MYLHPPKTSWKTDFQEERQRILAHYGDALELHHIGSTAIIGLYAKDCIDILGIVKNLSEVTDKKAQLINLGYAYKGAYGIEGREYFSKKERKVHLHIFEEGDINIRKHLRFIEVMQGNMHLIRVLNYIKKDLHKRNPNDQEAYQREKKYFYDIFIEGLK